MSKKERLNISVRRHGFIMLSTLALKAGGPGNHPVSVSLVPETTGVHHLTRNQKIKYLEHCCVTDARDNPNVQH